MKKLREELATLSITGRLCYLFMCIEKYLITCYPERDWTPVAKRFWQWTNVYWDKGCNIYSPVVPEFLLEFDNYEETNLREFDGILSQNDYMILKNLFNGITTGRQDDELNRILMLPMNFMDCCDGTSFANANEPTLMIIYEAEQFLLSHGISLPSLCQIKNMTIGNKNGWGEFVDSEYLSIIINT